MIVEQESILASLAAKTIVPITNGFTGTWMEVSTSKPSNYQSILMVA
jgi:hypothetical protein